MRIWDEVPEHLHSYFDLDAWWRDERYDYTIANAPDGGVFIFRAPLEVTPTSRGFVFQAKPAFCCRV